MKKLFTLLLFAVCCIAGYAQAVIDPLLSEEMTRRSDDEKIKVIVIMKSQYDRAQMNRRADYYVNRSERREFVVNELKAFAYASQYDLRHSLAEMQRNDMTTEPVVLWMANALYFDATKAAIQDLAYRNDIEIMGFAKEYNWIPDGEEATPAMATREITQNVIQVHANQVWELGYTGQGVVVAVIDTGVNYHHVDLADHLWDGGSDFPNHGYDVYNHDNDPIDDMGHGSHCAGTVCGDGSGASQTGMAPDATLMCVKCLDGNGNGGAQSISEGIQWAVEHGCDLFSMFEEQDEVLYLKQDSHWNNKGALMAYDNMLDQLNKDHNDYSSAEVTRTKDSYGDLSKMLYPAARKSEFNYNYELNETYSYETPTKSVEDAITFPYGDGAVEGASVEITDDMGVFYQ